MSVTEKKCCICGQYHVIRKGGNYYCNRHYQSMIRYGHPYGKKRKRTCQYVVDGNLLTITTAKGQNIYADAEDLEKLSRYSWCISAKGYAVASINNHVKKMHQYLIDIPDGMVVDHINRNKLDNRRTNLRICTAKENGRNISSKNKVHGIRKTPCGKYSVRITADRKERYIGTFSSYAEAVEARHEAEDKYHGEYGYHNSAMRSEEET